MSDCLMAQDGAGVSVPNIVLETPSSPLAWTVVCILAFIILILISVILVMTKKKLAMDTSLNPEIKKEVEEVYARKVKREYLDKQKVLDNKLNQVRLRFSIVMGKVKTLLDTLSPDKLFNAICDLIQTDVGANRYIIFLRDEIKHELYPFRWYGYSDEIKKALIIPDNLPHILCYALKRKQNVFRAD